MSGRNDKCYQSDVICLDSSQESIKCDQQEDEEEGEVSDEVIICEKSVRFNETLPSGSAPEGFVLIDESIEELSEPRKVPPEPEDGTEAPILKVIFRDKDAARKYKWKIQDFLTQLIFGEAREDKNASKPTLDIWPSNKSKKRKLDGNGLVSATDNTLFMIDSNPHAQESLDVPTYGRKFEKVLKDVEDVPDIVEEKEKAAPKLNCFNCLGNHNLRDCPVPRNSVEINKNRKDFNNRTGPKSVRYHVDEDTKFDHFKPGILSQELRRALGLADNQLPRHIYKMRILGYPPGWLEEARLQHSGINLYNSEGLRETELDEEQGEIFTSESRDKYDIRKIHDYPGFNIPAPPGTSDAAWDVEQRAIHSKDTMLAKMSGRKVEEGYKRKKMKRSGTSQNLPFVEPVEMEVDVVEDTSVELLEVNGHFVPPLPDDSEISPLPPPPGCEEDTSPIDSTSGVASPSLSELENRKQKLLDSLEDTNSQSNPGSPSRSCLNIPGTPENLYRIGGVKSVELGTPILQSTSPFTKLPSSEKFSKDICDVINFENLPNSTGKYEKMTGILQKVRGVLSSTPK
ncbi:zinc finger CCHC domain-containing protein 8 homolog [Diachasma alloeum]|uniref:zinc finger CCHC domain-containing protein 8 homolog n=1 Tax=Diachasma alloeum TaxID=454923 RepID=UPI0007384BA5|nr:zinc finger CCHC domain-containing protein 8 homolog [Diachasma alloeum]